MATLRQPEAVLAVIKFADGWRILPGGTNPTTYPSQEAAIAVARRLIELAGLSGREVRLLVQQRFGELCEAPSEPAPPPVGCEEVRRTSAPERSVRQPPARSGAGPVSVAQSHPGAAQSARL